MTTNTFFMYYDKSIFDEEDLKSLEKMLEKGRVSINLESGFYNSAFYLGAGCDFFRGGTDRNAGITLNTKETKEVTDYLVDLSSNPSFVQAKPDEAVELLREHKIDAYWCGSWQAEETKKILGENFGVTVLPVFHIGQKRLQCSPFASCKAVGVSSSSPYPEEAMAFAFFIAGEEGQKLHYEKRSYVPCFLSLMGSEMMEEDPLVSAAVITDSHLAFPIPPFCEMERFWKAARTFGKKITGKEITHENSGRMTEEFSRDANGF